MRKILLMASICGLLALVAPAHPAFADGGLPVGSDAALSAAEPIPASLTVSPSYSFTGVKHVAAGVSMRDKLNGVIKIRGIPSGSFRHYAYLYWTILDGDMVGAGTSLAVFDGNLVTGYKVADSASPCWAPPGAHTYRARVSELVVATNVDHTVFFAIPAGVDASGKNPWAPTDTNPIMVEGASLIVTYTNSSTYPTTAGVVSIYDNFPNSMIAGIMDLYLNHGTNAIAGTGLFTMVGADGQTGGGYTITSAATEKTYFNGVQIAGAGSPNGNTDSQWNGSDGFPLPQLWDTHTIAVSFSGTQSWIRWDVPADCVLPVVVVLQQGLTP